MKNTHFLMIINSLTRSKLQKLMAFVTVCLASTLIACMLNITLKIGDEVASELRSYGSNIVVLPRGESLSIEIEGRNFTPLKSQNFLNESDLYKIKEIFWRNNIVAFAPFLEGKMNDSKGRSFSIMGTYFDKNIGLADEPEFSTGAKSLFGFWGVVGNWVKDDSLDEALIGEKLSQDLSIKVGDVLNFNGNDIKIVGILKGAGDESSKLVVSLKLAQKLFDKIGKFQKAEVSAMTIPENDLSLKARKNLDNLDSAEYDKWYCSAYVSSIAYQIEENFSGVSAKPSLQVSDAESHIVKKIQSLMGIVSIIALFVSSIGITSLMTSEIYRRKKEIGLLKALGASNFAIYTLFTSESLVVAFIAGLVGSFIGYVVSYFVAYTIFSHGIGLALIIIPLSVFFSLLVSIIGSIIPMKSLINLLPAEVLYDRK
ncbi:ferrirhodotorulic acid ABC transporter, permease protein [Campylobacter pinnipediorum subsp. pinnipediorum]|uniref:ABC transporter permease n=1 Tax=Campylobacter pinnipediorum TaxID=1965231 RepID=UPI00099547D0|nr:ABC transporter permease [Campylobacter pinnipediorum]AQW83780.1 ferrirhodotorulic acid ABC transporter, permease protein [Campylobacter pinnipediorum subsp. pinnipediorum]